MYMILKILQKCRNYYQNWIVSSSFKTPERNQENFKVKSLISLDIQSQVIKYFFVYIENGFEVDRKRQLYLNTLNYW